MPDFQRGKVRGQPSATRDVQGRETPLATVRPTRENCPHETGAIFLDLRDEGGVARSEPGCAAQKQCAGRADTRLASKAGGEARGES